MFQGRRILRFSALLLLLLGAAFWLANHGGISASAQARPTPEERAVAFLGREVPRWHRENHCYSCHNNGDGARALSEARRQGFPLRPNCLDDTRAWLEQPLNWDQQGGEGGFGDKVLVHIQFARTLAHAGAAHTPSATQAARMVALDQLRDGHWRIDDGGTGTPCTYGNALATAQALQALEMLKPNEHAAAIERARQWLARQPRNSLVDQAAMLLGFDRGHEELRRTACAEILASQNADGGWGPYATSGSEPFDTAIAILGLLQAPDATRNHAAVEKGRRYLLKNQQADGDWIETTRPPGAVSYAQRLSTTSWATLALLATRNWGLAPLGVRKN
jgi:hypothetical protein